VSYSQPVDATPGVCTHTEAHIGEPKTVAICKASTGEQCRADEKCTFNGITAAAGRTDDLWYRHPDRRLRHAEAILSTAQASSTVEGCAAACLATTSFPCRSFDFYNDKCYLNPSTYSADHALVDTSSAEAAASGAFYYEWISSNEEPTETASQCTHVADLSGDHYQVAKCKGFKGSACRHGLRWSLIDTGATLSWDDAAARATAEGGSLPTLADARLLLAQRIGKVAYVESDWTDDKQNGIAAGSLSDRTGVWAAVSNEAEAGDAQKQWIFIGTAENNGVEESQKLYPGKAAAGTADGSDSDAPSTATSTYALVLLPYTGSYVEDEIDDATHSNGKGKISRSNGCTFSAGAVAVKGEDEAKAAFYIQTGEQLGATGA
jgi:hypothetical protein